jgi:hypothetical protein
MVHKIKKHPALLSIVLVIAALPVLMKSSWLTFVSASAVTVPPAGFASTVIRAGLGPVELAAAGVTDEQATTVAQNLLAEWNSVPTALPDAQASYVAAKQQGQRLQRLIHSGRASDKEVSAYGSAQATLAKAEAAREAALDSLFMAGVASLSEAQVACLSTLRDNSEQTTDLEFRVVDRTEAEWLALDNALANERIAADYGETPASDCVTHLAAQRSDKAVATARSSCEAHVESVRVAWNAAVGGS